LPASRPPSWRSASLPGAGRGRRVGCERQLAKATRRLAAFAPEHRGVDVAAVLRQLEAAQFPNLAPLVL
jgi:hypothetical protein